MLSTVFNAAPENEVCNKRGRIKLKKKIIKRAFNNRYWKFSSWWSRKDTNSYCFGKFAEEKRTESCDYIQGLQRRNGKE